MADTAIVYDIIAHDHATSKINKVKAATKLLALAAGAMALKFGVDSVKAYAEAQQAQSRLGDAFKRFPKLADTNIGRLQALNAALGKKTKFDDDATASGQAVLAGFGVTGKELEKLTPLMQDYAARTGKDLPTAAKDLGKAILGSAGPLKKIGLDLKDTGSKAGNAKQLIAGLRSQVGGFAEREGKTAAGQAEILKNQFGEIEESVGAGLMPVLQQLTGVLLKVVGFIQDNSTAAKIVVGVLGTVVGVIWLVSKAMKAWTAIQLVFNAVMSANPIALVIIAIAALVIGIIIAYKKSETFRAIVQGAMRGVVRAFHWVIDAGKATWDFLKKVWNGIVGAIRGSVVLALGVLDKFLGGIAVLVGVMAKLPGPLGAPFRAAQGAIQKTREGIWKLQGDLRGVKSPPPIVVTAQTRQARSDLADLLYQLNHVPRQVTIGFQSKMSGFPGRAGGGPVSAGHAYIVGENNPELFVPSVPGRIVPRVTGVPGSGSGRSRADLDYLAGRIGEVVLAGMSAALVGTARRSDRLSRGG